ncbi:hypothetical protein ABZP36_016665 [Zizania latifolia]
MPMSDAARVACLSRAFLSSWRYHPNLTLDAKTLCMKASRGKFRRKVDNILTNHSGTVKILKLNVEDEYNTFHYIDRWLQVADTPGIEELTLTLYKKYSFPCSLLSDGVRASIRCFELHSCAFHPMADLGSLRRLTNLALNSVHFTGDELECLLSNSVVLEQLSLHDCNKIRFLKIPSVLKQLSYLNVIACWRLKEIVCEAPNMSDITLYRSIRLSLGEPLKMKRLCLGRWNVVCYARAELPSIMPNLEIMTLSSGSEAVNVPMLPTKFLYLKHLTIQMTQENLTPSNDYFSLVSFLDASPSLETLFPTFEAAARAVEHNHDCLKSVEIIGFSSAKCLVELTCCIVKTAASLERLTLDTLRGGYDRCSGESNKICCPVSEAVLKEAPRAVVAAQRFIEDKVAPTTKLNLLGPCARCHSIDGPYAKLCVVP